jgi:hypothetical protein
MQNKTKMKALCGASLLALCLVATSCSTGGRGKGEPLTKAATPDQAALDKLLAPIALYPDALLAQVLACSTSSQQVLDFNKWLQENQALQGSQRQQAAEQAGFDASFVALSLFPDVVDLMAKNIDWTTELGKAFISDQKAVLDSAQRLRAQAMEVGNLQTTPQQEVRTEKQEGQQTIVIQPANPQVVYVPQYNPQTVYTSPPPPDNSKEKAVAAGLIGFTMGIVLGAAINDNHYYAPYGWGAWGMGWHSHTVIVSRGPWGPPVGRYPYARPVPHYRPNVNVYAPTYNVNRANYNRAARPMSHAGSAALGTRPAPNARPLTAGTHPATRTTAAHPATASQRTAAPRPQTSNRAATNYGNRGYAQAGSSASAGSARPASNDRSGTRSSAFSGYQSGGTERASSTRGRSSLGSGGKSRGRHR